MNPDFDAIAADLERRTRIHSDSLWGARERIRAQLALAYQEGVCAGLKMAEESNKAAFAKVGGGK